ncbi:MAG: shikimate dehydrogenase [Geminicoccaceae bacterium]
MTISGKARLAGVLGWPVGHSKSPLLHNFWFERHGLDGVYVPLPVAPEDLAPVMRALPRMGFLGCNVTLPHKAAMLDLVDAVDPLAAAIGAVNTVLVGDAGSLTGYNTDGLGFLAHLDGCAPDWRAATRRVVLLGAGGAARALAFTFLAAGIHELALVNRTPERAAALVARLGDQNDAAVLALPWAERHRALEGADLLVNTTSLGMVGQPALDLDLAALPATAIVADIVYTPLVTPLLAEARRRGHRIVDGLGMLLHQAVPGFTHWGGTRPVVDEATRRLMLAPSMVEPKTE